MRRGCFHGVCLHHCPLHSPFLPFTGLAPTSDANAFINKRSKELNNGRLAMLAWAGMVVQEVVTNSKIFS